MTDSPHVFMLYPGEKIISSRSGQADRFRDALNALNREDESDDD